MKPFSHLGRGYKRNGSGPFEQHGSEPGTLDRFRPNRESSQRKVQRRTYKPASDHSELSAQDVVGPPHSRSSQEAAQPPGQQNARQHDDQVDEQEAEQVSQSRPRKGRKQLTRVRIKVYRRRKANDGGNHPDGAFDDAGHRAGYY